MKRILAFALAACGGTTPAAPPADAHAPAASGAAGAASAPADDCAELRAERAATIAEGKGERHPTVLAIDARIARCVHPDAPLAPSTCARLASDRAASLAGGKGPEHPAVKSIDAKLAFCGASPPP
jgi:hypothetical protein